MERNLTLPDLKSEYRVCFSGDDWGSAMEWWFSVADEIYFNRDFPVPAEWQFRPSPLGPQNDPESLVTYAVARASDEALQSFGAILFRYAERLKARGLNY